LYGYLIYKDLKRIKGENLEIKKSGRVKLLILAALGFIVSISLIMLILNNLADFMLQYSQ
jgi:hypothetical protein